MGNKCQCMRLEETERTDIFKCASCEHCLLFIASPVNGTVYANDGSISIRTKTNCEICAPVRGKVCSMTNNSIAIENDYCGKITIFCSNALGGAMIEESAGSARRIGDTVEQGDKLGLCIQERYIAIVSCDNLKNLHRQKELAVNDSCVAGKTVISTWKRKKLLPKNGNS